ncbi:MAG: anti-sigma factor family protein [Mycobacteriales bacterium]
MNTEPMHPVADADGHLDAATVAGLDAEVFDAETAGGLSAHVAMCARCSAELAGLRQLRTTLAALPAPRMPEAVAARLEAVIRTEQKQRWAAQHSRPAGPPGPAGPFGQQPPPPGPPRITGAPLPPQGRPPPNVVDLASRRPRNRILAAVAGVAIVGVGIGVAISTAGNGGKGTNVAGNIHRSAVGTTQPGGGDSGTGQGPAPGGSGQGGERPTPGAFDNFGSGTELESQLERIIKDGSGSGDLSDPAQRKACLASAGDSSSQPIAVKRIQFQSQPSYVFVLRSDKQGASTSQNVRVVVVPATCASSSSLVKSLFDDPQHHR